MTAPFPPEVDAGRDPAESEALNLYQNFGWMARLADEMNAASDLDLKRVRELVLNARKFRVWREALIARVTAGRPAADIGRVVQSVFAMRGVIWVNPAAMNADLDAVYTAAGTISDWADNNAAAYKTGFSVNGVDENGNPVEIPQIITKTQAHATFLGNFRALWGAR